MSATGIGERFDVAAVRAAHPIAEVVAASGVHLVPRGSAFMGCCPFHDDSTPSLSVGGVPDRFHCFGCGAQGDVIDYVTRICDLPFRQAIEALQDGTAFGGYSPTLNPARPSPTATRELSTAPQRAYQVNELAWEHFTRAPAVARGEAYLSGERAINLTALRAASGGDPIIGYAGTSWHALARHLSARGVIDTELLDLDLAHRARTGELIDTYRGRLILPVRDTAGRIEGFIGRDTTGDPRAPKYRNPTRTPTFDKSTALYRPTQHALDEDASVVVVEGVLDALAIAAAAAALGQPGRYGPCTTSGVTASSAQAEAVLALHERPPVIALDGDAAGAQGTGRWLHLLCLTHCRPALVTSLPAGSDPAQWLRDQGEVGLTAFDRRRCLGNPRGATAPHLPGRELVDACLERITQPVPAVLAALIPLATQVPQPAAEILIHQAEREMTVRGWNPDHEFSRALRRALDTALWQHGIRTAARTSPAGQRTRDLPTEPAPAPVSPMAPAAPTLT